MGYFGNLYLVEVYKEKELTKVKTTIYSGHLNGRRAYFSWNQGERPLNQLYAYADNTLFTDTKLEQLRGYPSIKEYGASEEFLLDASFVPKDINDPVVFHFVLNKHYVPKRDDEIFEQPSSPSISKQEDKLLITYPIVGAADLRFRVTPIPANQSLDNYNLEKLVRPDKPKTSKRVVGINLYFFKFEWQFEG